MLFTVEEKVIIKKISTIKEYSTGKIGHYKTDDYQKFLSKTWWFLFIPIFKYDKRI